MEKCDECGTALISPCLDCGAPVCCPLCCAKDKIQRLEAEVERKTALLASIHEDLFLRKSDDGVVPLSNWIWEQLKELLAEGAAG